VTASDDDGAGEAGFEERRHETASDDDGAGEAGFEERRHEGTPDQQPAISKPDPWKSFRGVTAGTLILEVIVVLLALPVVGAVGGGLNAGALTYLLGMAAVLLVLAGLQGRPWAIWADLGVQVIPVAGFVIYPEVGVIGLIFVGVWALIAYVRAEVLRRERLGLLPGQEGPAD
jgi:Protein of unknown function (DUF4233)